WAATVSMVTAHCLGSDAMLLAGDEPQKTRYLPGAAAGRLLGAFALSEPAAGSNPADMTTRAIPTPAGFRLAGVKHFISNAGHADFSVTFPRAGTSDKDGPPAITAFRLDK